MLENEVLGIVVAGGVGGTHANPFDYYDEGIFISKVITIRNKSVVYFHSFFVIMYIV